VDPRAEAPGHRSATSGESHAFGGTCLKFVPSKHLVYTNSFDDPNLPGQMKVIVSLKIMPIGTEVSIEQQGVLGYQPN